MGERRGGEGCLGFWPPLMRHVQFALGEIEPFFCSFALYRRDTKEKISETFHFDLNTEKLRGMIPTRAVRLKTIVSFT